MVLKLTPYEQEMLDGKHGHVKQYAMQRITKYAEILGATELCEVTKATYHCGYRIHNHVVEGDYYATNTNFYMGKPFDFRGFEQEALCMTDAEFMPDEHWDEACATDEFANKYKKYLALAAEEGMVLGATCAPYLSGWIPTRGEHFVTTESSNILFCNSFFSAMANGGGNPTNFASILCGRTPKWGLHCWECRYGTHIFNIRCKTETIHDWDIMGHAIGRKMPNGAIPILVGDFGHVSIEKLKQCFSSMATTSSAEMCHIVGVTPEAPTLEAALQGHEPEGVINITDEDIADSLAIVCAKGSGPVDYISLGCPHMTIEELRSAARYLKGKKIKKGVTLHLWTALSVKAMADVSGFTKIIENTGARILTGCCPLKTSCASLSPEKGEYCTGIIVNDKVGLVFDSSKQAHYLLSSAKAPIYYGDMFACIDAAISGRWEGK